MRGSGRNGDRAREARGARAAGKGGVEQEEGYRRAAREDASVPLSTCSRACLSRALSCSRSPFSPPLSRSPSLSVSPLSLLVSLARARGRTFRLSRRVCLSLFSPLFLLPVDPSRGFSRSLSPLLFLSLFLSPSLCLVLAIGLGRRDRARPTPFSSHSLPPPLSLIRSRRFRLPSSSRRSESNRL